ncbi:hypothetical protein LTR56_012921 [Elasticomyces elasticus]|nr:hypothetical protein LTR56_012921 [Elasticomyces elasticus]KAK3668009.1 hypothetical protein LTR22_001076 [Elasticomyces elasticus]KAK4925050.1 hypothetical protein LTR49_007823 [Elasticomyces elasticus]KAK5767649.1 hypothetical protein LTS12_002150 [Elasticomyces elasticus]
MSNQGPTRHSLLEAEHHSMSGEPVEKPTKATAEQLSMRTIKQPTSHHRRIQSRPTIETDNPFVPVSQALKPPLTESQQVQAVSTLRRQFLDSQAQDKPATSAQAHAEPAESHQSPSLHQQQPDDLANQAQSADTHMVDQESEVKAQQ